MKAEEAVGKFPLMAAVVGEEWLLANRDWFEAEEMPRPLWYAHVDRDLGVLAREVATGRLIKCYRDMLRDHKQFMQTVLEIHGAALMSETGNSVDLHVPTGLDSNDDGPQAVRGSGGEGQALR